MQKQWSAEAMNRWKKTMNQQTDESMNHWTTEWVNQWSNESMNQRTNESRNQRTNESMNRGIKALVRLHLPKVLRSPQCFAILKRKSSYTLVHILPTWSSKSAPIPSVSYLRFWSANRARYSLVHILLTSSSEVLRDREFFNVFKGKSSSRWHLSQIKPPNRRNRDPTSAAPGAKLPEKNTEFRARDRYNYPWIHTLPKCYTSQLLDDDGWLTWWCGWHDGVNANHDHRPWLRSFLTELPLIRRIESCASTRNTSLLASNRATSGPNSSPFSYQPLDFGGFSPCFARKPISRAQGH